MLEKVCFVIAPIGDEGSAARKRSDRMFTFVIEPAAKQCGYQAVRAGKILKPGIITDQMIQHVINAPMAVADLTWHNANAFYELAVRHMVKKPLVQMITKGERIPFDVAARRLIASVACRGGPHLSRVPTLADRVVDRRLGDVGIHCARDWSPPVILGRRRRQDQRAGEEDDRPTEADRGPGRDVDHRISTRRRTCSRSASMPTGLFSTTASVVWRKSPNVEVSA